MASADTIEVEVAYALPDRQWLRRVTLPAGATAAEAVQTSGLLQDCPGIVLEEGLVGVHALRVPLSRRLANGDRVEVYRQLVVDPKAARRQRAAARRSSR